jgi:hypothetical protein
VNLLQVCVALKPQKLAFEGLAYGLELSQLFLHAGTTLVISLSDSDCQ